MELAAKCRILRMFVSYAHEDEGIAMAVYKTLQKALGDTLVDVFLDKMSLEIGNEFKSQIEKRLRDTDFFIIVYTGVEKPSHSYSGWEVGFFQDNQRQGEDDWGIKPTIVPLYVSLYGLPPTVSNVQGIELITRENLLMSEDDFNSKLTTDLGEHPVVKFLDKLKKILARIREQGGFPEGHSIDTAKCVREMLIEIFSFLKKRVDKTLKPQKQITVRTNVRSLIIDGNLPGDAELRPVGSGTPMSTFGLREAPIRWDAFISQVSPRRLRESWKDAINSVVASSLADQIEVDNSQIIMSSDEQHVYRLILTTCTTYFNGDKDFNLHLVESLRRTDYGDRNTTLLLNGLELVCRFRFMFIEEGSKFYNKRIRVVELDSLPGIAREMIRELNLLRRDAGVCGLDKENVWRQFVTWDDIVEMADKWEPLEQQVRDKAGDIGSHRGDVEQLRILRREFADILERLEKTIGPLNRGLIEQMSGKLKQIVAGN